MIQFIFVILFVTAGTIGFLRYNKSIELLLDKPNPSLDSKIINIQYFCALTFVCYLPTLFSILLFQYIWPSNIVINTLLIVIFMIFFIIQLFLFLIWVAGLFDPIKADEYLEYETAWE